MSGGKAKKNRDLWLHVQKDDPGLVLGVYDTAEEMARALGRRTNTIVSICCKYRRGLIKKTYVERVTLPEDDWWECHQEGERDGEKVVKLQNHAGRG